METLSKAIIGAGIKGLSVATKLSETNEGINMFEKKRSLGKGRLVVIARAEYFTQVFVTPRTQLKPARAIIEDNSTICWRKKCKSV